MPGDKNVDEIKNLTVDKVKKDGETYVYVGPFSITEYEKDGNYFEIPEQLKVNLKNFKLCWLFNEEGGLVEAYSIDEQEKVFVIKDFTPFPTGCCIEELNVELERISYSPDDLDKIREASYILVNSIKNRDWDEEFVDDRTGYT